MARQSAEQRRKQLLEAALSLFSVHGFEGTTTRAIAEAAGVTEALIFHYFPTKLALFRDIIAEYGFQRLYNFEPGMPADRPLPEVLTAALTLFLDTLWKNRMALRLLYGATASELNALQSLKSLDTRPRERLRLLLLRYETAGSIVAGMSAPAAKVISAAVLGFLVASLRAEPEDWEAARTDFVNDLIRVILPGLQSSTATL